MSKKSFNPERAEKLFANGLCRKNALPFSFKYKGRKYAGVKNAEITECKTEETPEGKVFTLVFKPDKELEVTYVVKYCAEFGESEYTVWFENKGDKPSGVLSDVITFAHDFKGEKPELRGNLGDHDNFYAAYDKDLEKEDVHFISTNGRSTHIVFPYFDLVHGNGGTMIALGWAGTWETTFAARDGVTNLTAKTCIDLNTVLLPGEKVRTGLVVLLPYKGRDYFNATNLWREWFMKYNVPKMDKAGTPMHPFSTVGFAGDTGLPNSDGSISERYFTWKPTLDRLVKENVLADFRWFDAGWYYDPAGRTVETDWWGTVGSWELDRVKWPYYSFRMSNEACQKLGMKVFVWFEPERVTNVDDLVKNYGYKKEWGVGDLPVITNNIGDDECLAWTLNRITRMMHENAVDLYREDNNSDPVRAWQILDDRDMNDKNSPSYGLPRHGINENKCICGHYKLWDGIIDFCAKNGKCTFVDSCASGGGRNDIESMRRGVPMMRSDYDRTSSSMRLSQTETFCKWIPFHGSTTKEVANQLDIQTNEGTSPYVSRASLLPIYNYGEGFNHNKNLDYDLLRRNIAEWRSINHLLVKDMYVLTPWRHNEDRKNWTAIAYDDPKIGDSLLLVFRQEEAPEDSFTVKLPFAEDECKYELTNADTGKVTRRTGKTLRTKGIEIKLSQPKSSAFIRIKRV